MDYTSARILEFSVLAGKTLLESGGEITRVNDTMERILEAFGIREHNVYVISNAIFASVREDGCETCHALRHVPLGEMHLARIDAVNQLSREIAAGNTNLDALTVRLEEISRMPAISGRLKLLAGAVASAGFCYILGGSLWDSFAALLAGGMLQLYQLFGRRFQSNKFLGIIVGGAWATFCSRMLLLAQIGSSLDNVIIGAIVCLMPGVVFTTAIRDYFNSDYLAGTIHLVEALLVAVCIAVGVGSMHYLFGVIEGVAA